MGVERGEPAHRRAAHHHVARIPAQPPLGGRFREKPVHDPVDEHVGSARRLSVGPGAQLVQAAATPMIDGDDHGGGELPMLELLQRLVDVPPAGERRLVEEDVLAVEHDQGRTASGGGGGERNVDPDQPAGGEPLDVHRPQDLESTGAPPLVRPLADREADQLLTAKERAHDRGGRAEIGLPRRLVESERPERGRRLDHGPASWLLGAATFGRRLAGGAVPSRPQARSRFARSVGRRTLAGARPAGIGDGME